MFKLYFLGVVVVVVIVNTTNPKLACSSSISSSGGGGSSSRPKEFEISFVVMTITSPSLQHKVMFTWSNNASLQRTLSIHPHQLYFLIFSSHDLSAPVLSSHSEVSQLLFFGQSTSNRITQ